MTLTIKLQYLFNIWFKKQTTKHESDVCGKDTNTVVKNANTFIAI